MAEVWLAERDPGTVEAVARELGRLGHRLRHVPHGAELEAALAEARPDVLVVERRLGDVDGLTIIETMRARGDSTPVLFLSTVASLEERVRGLRAGGDDYLAKPFALVELMARIESLLRRPAALARNRLVCGPFAIDLVDQSARRGRRALHLSPRELALLAYFVRRPRQVVSRAVLLRDIWGYDFDPASNLVDVHIGRLRRKVDMAGEPSVICSARGRGYFFAPPE